MERASGAKATDIAREVGAIRRAYYQRIREAKGKGQSVAWSMMYGPDEILAAFDIVTVLAENYGPVCAAKQVSDRYCGIAEAEGFSQDVCSYLRVGLGMAKLMHDAGGEPPPDAPYGGMPAVNEALARQAAANADSLVQPAVATANSYTGGLTPPSTGIVTLSPCL